MKSEFVISLMLKDRKKFYFKELRLNQSWAKIILILRKCVSITEDMTMNESVLSKDYHYNWDDLITK